VDLGLKDKVVLITGGTGAICLQIARRFAEEGSRVVLTDVRPPAEDPGFPVLLCDVRDEARVARTAAGAAERFGGVDVLVNGAGVMTWIPIVELDVEEWDRVVDINLKGTFLVSRAIAPQMMARGGGKIVNIASGLAHTPIVEVGHYAAAKAGIVALTKTMALEWAKHRINVNAVGPGVVDTPLIWPKRTRDELAVTATRIPWGRVGVPDDVAKVILFLASEMAEYMTGQTLYINGGALMP
jgi:3-oxoacyl-[acyl-carrier protein] reductase